MPTKRQVTTRYFVEHTGADRCIGCAWPFVPGQLRLNLPQRSGDVVSLCGVCVEKHTLPAEEAA